MDELDEKLTTAAGHAARRLAEREAANSEEDARRDGKRRKCWRAIRTVKSKSSSSSMHADLSGIIWPRMAAQSLSIWSLAI